MFSSPTSTSSTLICEQTCLNLRSCPLSQSPSTGGLGAGLLSGQWGWDTKGGLWTSPVPSFSLWSPNRILALVPQPWPDPSPQAWWEGQGGHVVLGELPGPPVKTSIPWRGGWHRFREQWGNDNRPWVRGVMCSLWGWGISWSGSLKPDLSLEWLVGVSSGKWFSEKVLPGQIERGWEKQLGDNEVLLT